jgi:transcriptional regulator with XRE-family HTH domain
VRASEYRYFILLLELQKIVGQNIRAHRRSKAWSIEKLAEHADVSPAYLGELERGRENVSVKTIEAIAKALKISPDILLKENSK